MRFEKWLNDTYKDKTPKFASPLNAAYNVGVAKATAELTALIGCGHLKACRKTVEIKSDRDCVQIYEVCTVCAELAAVTKERDALKATLSSIRQKSDTRLREDGGKWARQALDAIDELAEAALVDHRGESRAEFERDRFGTAGPFKSNAASRKETADE